MVGGWSLFAFSKYELYEVFFFFYKRQEQNRWKYNICFEKRLEGKRKMLNVSTSFPFSFRF